MKIDIKNKIQKGKVKKRKIIKSVQVIVMAILFTFSQWELTFIPVLAAAVDYEEDQGEVSTEGVREKILDKHSSYDTQEALKKEDIERKEQIKNEQGEIQYIVSTNKKSQFQSAKESCDEVDTEYKKELHKGNRFISQMTTEEVKELKKEKGVTIEKDFVLIGASSDFENEVEAINELAQEEWNVKMINCQRADIISEETKESLEVSKAAIKVAVLDSGRTFSSDIAYEGGCNLVDPEINPYGTDLTTHGVGVAGIIAAKDDDEDTTGVAGDVTELYSVKVLDANNETTVSRLIAGIQWCIDNDIQIINMSVGTPNYSAAIGTVTPLKASTFSLLIRNKICINQINIRIANRCSQCVVIVRISKA